MRHLSEHVGGAVGAFDHELGWSLLLSLAKRASNGQPVHEPTGFLLLGDNWLEVPLDQARVVIDPRVPGLVRNYPQVPPNVRSMLELYLPLVLGERASELAVGHLGQSLDGRIATPTGNSQFITGREDVVHTHRMRALFDAVVVGVRTVLVDDPQLTTRLVPGAHPTRVVLDPRGRLGDTHKVLCDGMAPTLVCASSALVSSPDRLGRADRIGVAADSDGFDVDALMAALRARGLKRIFIEGGGVTVSRFLSAGVLDRVQITVAPMILGSGAPAIAMPPIDQLDEALTPRCRHFVLGRDVMFDCELVRREPATST